MSHFYAEIDNYRARTKCTRRGFVTSGMMGYVQGHNVGVRVEIRNVNGKDLIKVYKTGGKNNPNPEFLTTISE